MSNGALLELLLGLVGFVAGVWLYRKRTEHDSDGPRRYGSQGGTFLILVGLLLIAHALGKLGAVW